jgi:hexokinase
LNAAIKATTNRFGSGETHALVAVEEVSVLAALVEAVGKRTAATTVAMIAALTAKVFYAERR